LENVACGAFSEVVRRPPAKGATFASYVVRITSIAKSDRLLAFSA
jgi:hypothetical protein